jgi:SAM-dependent methyltransferase
MWGTLESDLGLLARCEPGMNVVELGCGTGAVCAGLARAGFHPVGVDFSYAQLETLIDLQRSQRTTFRVDQANVEAVPYDDASFDVAISEYGASVWSDPYRWIPEAARLLRPGGMLVFIVTSPLLMACTPNAGSSAGETLERSYFGMHRFEFAGDDVVEFHLGHADWFKVLTENGLTVENLVEVRPRAKAPPRYNFVSNGWARKWPSEDIWTARRR